MSRIYRRQQIGHQGTKGRIDRANEHKKCQLGRS